MEIEGIGVERLGHASIKLKLGSGVVYIDPYNIPEGEKADLILISHEHYDHCSTADIDKIKKDDTKIIAAERCGEQLQDYEVQFVNPGDAVDLGELKVAAVHAYNEKIPNHPRGHGCGFVVEYSGKRIYFAGDTDFIGEMRDLGAVDIALLPVGGTYTMDADEAAEAANTIRAKIVIPMHYGAIVGTDEDALKFKEQVTSSEVKIL